jgi:hypothetical protein
MNITTKGMLIAASAAALLATTALKAGDSSAAAKTAKVHCAGINTCKGTGECSGDGHGCAGMNTCKGKGWVTVTPAECSKKKGKVVDEKPATPAASTAAATAK